jgi:hypothetical protein
MVVIVRVIILVACVHCVLLDWIAWLCEERTDVILKFPMRQLLNDKINIPKNPLSMDVS